MAVKIVADREAVLRAIAEFDLLGRDAFLVKHHFGRAKAYFVVHEGRKYDSKAVYGVAYGFEHPGTGGLAFDQFSGGEAQVAARLRKLGFEIVKSGDQPPAPALNQQPQTFLLTWNPAKWSWDAMPDVIRATQAGERVRDQWSCSSAQVREGDRLYLLVQGRGARGLVGSGWVTGPVFMDAHWDAKKAAKGERVQNVPLEWDLMLPRTPGRLLDPANFRSPALAEVHWATQKSGIRISVAAARELEAIWRGHAAASEPRTESALVLTVQDATSGAEYDHWKDIVGEQFHFPNKYKNLVKTGLPFVYYRGVRRKGGKRGSPEYFGVGRIGEVWRDEETEAARASDQRWYCGVEGYRPFDVPVPWQVDGRTLEILKRNQFRDGVRKLPLATFQRICGLAKVPAPAPAADLPLPALDSTTLIVLETSETLLGPPSAGRGTRQGEQGKRSPSRRSRFAKQIGDHAEQIVYRHLMLSNKDSLRHHAANGETPGYDISYREEGRLVAVEVKGTIAKAFPNFEMTQGEREAAAELGDRYQVWLVSGVGSTTPRVEILVHPDSDLSSGDLVADPLLWRVSRGPR